MVHRAQQLPTIPPIAPLRNCQKHADRFVVIFCNIICPLVLVLEYSLYSPTQPVPIECQTLRLLYHSEPKINYYINITYFFVLELLS